MHKHDEMTTKSTQDEIDFDSERIRTGIHQLKHELMWVGLIWQQTCAVLQQAARQPRDNRSRMESTRTTVKCNSNSRRYPKMVTIVYNLISMMILFGYNGNDTKSGGGGVIVSALPKDRHGSVDKKNKDVRANSFHSLQKQKNPNDRYSSSSRSSFPPWNDRRGNAVALEDNFPCESDLTSADVAGNAQLDVGRDGDGHERLSSTIVDGRSISYGASTSASDGAQNSSSNASQGVNQIAPDSVPNDVPTNAPTQSPIKSIPDIVAFRGGGGGKMSLDGEWNDEEFDQIVDQLIAGISDSEVIEETEEEEDKVDISNGEVKESVLEEDGEDLTERAVEEAVKGTKVDVEATAEQPVENTAGGALDEVVENSSDSFGNEIRKRNQKVTDPSFSSGKKSKSKKLSRKHTKSNIKTSQPLTSKSTIGTPDETKIETVTESAQSSEIDTESQPDEDELPSPLPPLTSRLRHPIQTTPPTNAFYRFLVRRGPIGHIISTSMLLLVQWIYVYLPPLYNAIASLLLKLHIYDPSLLIAKEQAREAKRLAQLQKRQRGKSSLSSKIYGAFLPSSSSSTKKQTKQQAKEETQLQDLSATKKLLQLKSMGSNILDARYRYLSTAFQKRHFLGEYRLERPKSFMGEKVLGSSSISLLGDDQDGGLSQSLTSDWVRELEEEGNQSTMVIGNSTGQNIDDSLSSGNVPQQQQQQQQQRRRKRKKINDWVVQAFAMRHPSSNPKLPQTVATNNDTTTTFKSSPDSSKSSTLWDAVMGKNDDVSNKQQRNAIMEAAWASHFEERKVFLKDGGGASASRKSMENISQEDKKHAKNIENDSLQTNNDHSSASLSYSGSQMFRNVMSTVGSSNGRILGAYPMDALPIHECVNERGVIDLAKRYGYGDWREADYDYDEDNDDGSNDDDNDILVIDDHDKFEEDEWGGRNLFFRDNDNVDTMGGKRSTSSSSPTRKRKQRKRKKKRRLDSNWSSYDDVGGTTATLNASKRKRRRKRGGRVAFEFDIHASSAKSNRQNRHDSSNRRPFHSSAAMNERNTSSSSSIPSSSSSRTRSEMVQAVLEKNRQSSILYNSDRRVKAPMQLLNESKKKLNDKENERI